MRKNYESILRNKSLKLLKIKDTVTLLAKHLEDHPKDYQAVIKLCELKSDLIEREREVKQLNYLKNVEKYR